MGFCSLQLTRCCLGGPRVPVPISATSPHALPVLIDTVFHRGHRSCGPACNGWNSIAGTARGPQRDPSHPGRRTAGFSPGRQLQLASGLQWIRLTNVASRRVAMYADWIGLTLLVARQRNAQPPRRWRCAQGHSRRRTCGFIIIDRYGLVEASPLYAVPARSTERISRGDAVSLVGMQV